MKKKPRPRIRISFWFLILLIGALFWATPSDFFRKWICSSCGDTALSGVEFAYRKTASLAGLPSNAMNFVSENIGTCFEASPAEKFNFEEATNNLSKMKGEVEFSTWLQASAPEGKEHSLVCIDGAPPGPALAIHLQSGTNYRLTRRLGKPVQIELSSGSARIEAAGLPLAFRMGDSELIFRSREASELSLGLAADSYSLTVVKGKIDIHHSEDRPLTAGRSVLILSTSEAGSLALKGISLLKGNESGRLLPSGFYR